MKMQTTCGTSKISCAPLVSGGFKKIHLSNQQYKIMQYLFANWSITTREATRKLEIYRLSERIRELKKIGIPISMHMVKTKSGARVARYRLDNIVMCTKFKKELFVNRSAEK